VRRLPRLRLWGLTATALLAVAGCTASQAAEGVVSCTPTPAAALVPTDGIYLGTNLDWGAETVAQYAQQLGHRPAVVTSFTGFPFSDADRTNLDAAVEQVRTDGGMLLLTLEPHAGLAAVTQDVAQDLARRLDGYDRQGVPVIVRFGHEMNGSWYEWGQRPAEYVATFRLVAAAVHAAAPGSAMMWAPNQGSGYPYTGGRYGAQPGSPEAAALDTDGDGQLTAADDPYAPYWPGDDAVDWVGMSLYHWGAAHPWGENEVPEPGKFVAQLTGTYSGAGGDETHLPDFYAVYGDGHAKPVAIPETAALYAPGNGGADELAIKSAWMAQVLDPTLHERFPRLAMVNWFEWDKQETEIGAHVDWRAVGSPVAGDAYRAALPAWARFADAVPGCTS
jgi:hypothetical protein